MSEISDQVCEAVSACANLAKNTNGPFWDLKSILTTVGIAFALGWNTVQFISGKSRRKRDQKWEMFKDEVYSPFRELINGFEQEVRPAQLAVRLSSMNADKLAETIGDFHAIASEIEVYCERADKHEYTSNPNFAKIFADRSHELDACLGKLFISSGHEEHKFDAVSDAYRQLIDELQNCLSSCRKNLH